MSDIIYDLSHLSPELRAACEGEFRHLFTRKPDQMLRIGGDAKTSKGVKLGVRTAVLYLAPSDMSGQNVCPLAKLAACEAPCLFTAGRGGFQVNVMARLRKTLFLQQYRNEALQMLDREIEHMYTKAIRDGVSLHVRLNGTSDLRWENYSYTDRDGVECANLMETFWQVQFYDYTKIANRKNVPANYDLTFSYSGAGVAYYGYVLKAAAAGMRIAVVFRSRAAVEALIEGGRGFSIGGEMLPVVDGDDTDVRARDPKGVVVALYAKGAAKHDTSGFVVG